MTSHNKLITKSKKTVWITFDTVCIQKGNEYISLNGYVVYVSNSEPLLNWGKLIRNENGVPILFKNKSDINKYVKNQF